MYHEQQFHQNAQLRWLRQGSGAVVFVEIGTLIFAETGRALLPGNIQLHLGIFSLSLLMLLLASFAQLTLRIDRSGVAFRFFPFQWQFRRVGWDEVRRIAVLPPGQLPAAAPEGAPGADFTHTYIILDKKRPFLNLELINGHRICVSTQNGAALLEFLQRGGPI